MPRSAPASTGRLRCAVYCRISLARHGDTLKVDDQEKLCRKVARQRGWLVVEAHVYKDNSRSAWRRDRRRPGWDAMLAAVDRGEVDAIVVYHGDRLVRQPWDLELLLRVADEKGVRLAAPTGERDLDNPDDRFILRIEAAQACRESDNTSRRLKWHYAKQRELGVVRLGGRGGRAFGFEPDGQTVRAEEAAVIRDVARRIVAGEKTGAIARDLTAAGVRTTAGNPWDHGSLKKLMLRARLAGLVEHEGQLVKAVWPPILDREAWEEVRAALDRKAGQFGYATNARVYQLSGLAECGPCGSRLAIRHNVRGRGLLGYGCVNPACDRKVHRAVHHLDPYVDGYMIRLLADERIKTRVATPVSRELAEQLQRAEAHKKAVLESAAAQEQDDPETAADLLRVTVARLNERIRKLRAEIAAGQASHALDGLWGIGLAEWRGLPLSRRRAAISVAVRVVVQPGRRGPGFDPSTVQMLDLV